MALTTAFNPDAMGAGGSIIGYLREVKKDGTDLTTPDTNHRIPIIKESELGDETTVIKPRSEDGKLYNQLEDQRDVTFKLVLQQSDKATYDMFKEMRGKYYRLYKQTGKRNGKTQEWLYGICKLTPKLNAKWVPGTVTEIPCEVTVLANETQISIANSALPSEKVTATDPVLIPAGEYYVLLET